MGAWDDFLYVASFGLIDNRDSEPAPPPPPPPPPAPIVIRLPYPTSTPLTEVELTDATPECSSCNLSMKTNSAVSTVQLSRIVGAVSSDECNQYEIDREEVQAKRLSLFEFASRIHQGLYSTRKEAAQGYCRELGMSDANLQSIAQGSGLDESMLIFKRSRPESGSGGFSAETKAVFELSLPIDLVFSGISSYIRTSADGQTLPVVRERFLPQLIWWGVAGQPRRRDPAPPPPGIPDPDPALAALGPSDYPYASNTPTLEVAERSIVNRPISVKYMSLYHPFPLRVNGMQYDAALVLNDPSTPGENTATVVIIPLKISTNGDEPSAKFLNQVVRYLPAIRDIDPMTGQYPRATIPTGSNWNLSQLFNLLQPPPGATIAGEPNVKANDRLLIQNGYYVWSAHAGYDPVENTEYRPSSVGTQEIQWHGWTPRSGETSTLYIMLDAPRFIDSMDFVTLSRMLPATPPAQAIHQVPANANYIYHKAGVPPPDNASGKSSGASACSTNLCTESYVNYNSAVDFERAQTQFDILKKSLEGDYTTTRFASDLENCPGAKCDIFLQNLKQTTLPDHRIVLRVIYSVLFFLALVVGIYIAAVAGAKGYHTKVTYVGELFGKLAGIFARRWQTGVTGAPGTPAPAPAPAPPGPSLADQAMSFFRRSKLKA
jgi:hypothetical protein